MIMENETSTNKFPADNVIRLETKEKIERGRFAHRFRNKERKLGVVVVEIKGRRKKARPQK